MKDIDWTFDEEEGDDDIIRYELKHFIKKKTECVRNQKWNDAHYWRNLEWNFIKEHKNVLVEEYKSLNKYYQ